MNRGLKGFTRAGTLALFEEVAGFDPMNRGLKVLASLRPTPKEKSCRI